MVLFSTLARYSKEQQQGASSTTASSSIPTILQLYATPSNPLIHSLSTTEAPPAAVSKHAVLTYQAIEVDLHKEQEEDDEDVLFGVKKSSNNKLSNSNNIRPDLGLWHCRVDSQPTATDASPSLVDSLLTTMIPSVNTMTTTTTTEVVNWPICWTVDLSVPALVEPSMSRLSQTLIRYLVSSNASTAAAAHETDSKAPTTTSLKQLQATTFGLAPNDAADKNKAAAAAAEDGTEPDEDRRICLMIAALLPRQAKKSSTSSGGDQADWAATTYEEQQAQALVLYHLRRYAAAVNAILVFVQADAKPKKEKSSSSSSPLLPSVTKTQLWQLWQDLALGKEVWKKEKEVAVEEDPTSATADPAEAVVTPEEVAPAIYGPGQYHDDLIETVLLRNANCPGHWDAAKDSLWVALPAPAEGVTESTTTTASTSGTTKFGDDDWLLQLRDSVAGADPKAAAAAAAGSPPSKATVGADGVKSPEQDTGVASYFESLLKKP